MSETTDHATLVELTAEITKAYVAHHSVALADVPALISSVSSTLRNLGVEEQAPEAPEPAVSIRRSVTDDQIICLMCGKAQKLLRRHLATAHELSPSEYRELFKLKDDYPMTAPSYARMRSDMARKLGLGRPRQPSPPPAPTPRRRRAGKRVAA